MENIALLKDEIFKKILGYDYYYVSNYGRVYSSFKKSIRKQKHKPNGYLAIDLSYKGKHKILHIHRLVAQYFLPNNDTTLQVNHIDGNKKNNHISNLEWCSRVDNMKHAVKVGLCTNTHARKPVKQLDLEGNVLQVFKSAVEASEITGISWDGIKKARVSNKQGLVKVFAGFYWTY
jgi:hypothetical protein